MRALWTLISVLGAMTVVAADPLKAQEVHTEVVAFFFVSKDCPVSNSPEVKDYVRRATTLFRNQAEAAGARYAGVGVATDTHLDPAWKFIREYAPFEEIVVGREFFNSAVSHVMLTTSTATASTPQIIVLQRTVVEDDRGQLVFSAQKEILRLSNKLDIAMWLEEPSLELRGADTHIKLQQAVGTSSGATATASNVSVELAGSQCTSFAAGQNLCSGSDIKPPVPAA